MTRKGRRAAATVEQVLTTVCTQCAGCGQLMWVACHTQLTITTLSAGSHERFFAEVGEPKADPRGPFSTLSPDFEKLVTVGKHYGIEILPPSSSS